MESRRGSRLPAPLNNENEKQRKTSAPSITNTSSINVAEPFQFRSLRLDKRENCVTRSPSVSVIVEQCENENNDEDDFQDRRASVQNQSQNSQQSKRSNKSMKSIKSHSQVYVNKAYYNSRQSNPELHTSTSTLQSRVVHEQYCACYSCCCLNCSRRERILAIIIFSLVALIVGLIVAIAIVAAVKSNEDNDKPSFWNSL